MVTIVMWSIGPLFIKYFAFHYDVWTQNAFRYTCAAVILLIGSQLRGLLGPRLTGTQWRTLALIAAVNIILQCVFAGTFYFIFPAVASLVHRTNILFISVLSFMIFRDERRVIASAHFLGGSALALVGVVGVIVARDPKVLEQLDISRGAFWIGVGLAVAYALFLAFYTITIKRAVADMHPVLCFTHVSWMTALGLWVPMLVTGGVVDLVRQPVWRAGLMALSAVLFIVLAHTCLYAALREIKAVVSNSLLQLIPVLTCGFSAWYYGDRLTPMQITGGIAVIGGTWLAGMAQTRLARRSRRVADAGRAERNGQGVLD